MRKLIFALIALNLIAFSAVFLFSKISAPRASKFNSPTLEVENIELELWNRIQQWREEANLSKYARSDELCRISKERAIEQGSKDYLDNHKGFLERYSDYPFVVSENASISYVGAESHLNNWLHSAPHYSALLSNYHYSCVSCYQNVCVQIFSNFEQ